MKRFEPKERALLVLVFCIAFLAYTWSNHFPYFYHSDEESKALQILYGYRNYWHPLLTLNATALVIRIFSIPLDPQSVTLVGRYLAALFSSVGIIALVAFAFQRKGYLSGVLTGVLVLTCPLLFELSHYCKEDPALFMGVALSLLVWNAFLSSPSLSQAALLGLTTGIGISAKYPGIALLPIFFFSILTTFRPWKMAVVFLTCTVLTVLAIDWQWLAHFPEMIDGFSREKTMLINGHDGVSGSLPHPLYLQILLYEHGWLFLACAVLGVALELKNTRRFSLEIALSLLVIAILISLGFLAKVSDRYLLPVMMVLFYLAANGIVQSTRLFRKQLQVPVCCLLLATVSIHQLHLLLRFVSDFQSDSRMELVDWIHQNLPKDSRIATSLWTRLPGFYQGQYPAGAVPADFVADCGSLEDLKAAGFHWVAISDVEIQPFMHRQKQGSSSSQAAFDRRKSFYHQLMTNNPPVWNRPRGLIYILHPGLSLYRLD